VTPQSLRAVLRSLADAEPPASDGELLRRFLRGDDDAFAELVGRHGRLVWTACRHLTGSDAGADDAFQASFLVLVRNARSVRDAGRLSAWLYGVAYKVCARARRSAARRAARERAAAVSERNGSAVADSAWDRALAAVHEELATLPETLRVPFVLCCLEGKGVTEAAEQLGWKLGTFSGRLTRAKDALLAKLEARGLALGVVAGLGLAVPPPATLAKAAALARAGSAVPDSILKLTQGVIGMGATSFKVLVAVALLACGLGLGAGKGWVATADAQAPGQPTPPKAADAALDPKLLQADLERALGAFDAALLKDRLETYTAKTTKWEYDFVVVSDITQTKFVEFLQDRENRGWEFNGTTTFRHEGKPTPIWVFRRPAPAGATPEDLLKYHRKLAERLAAAREEPDEVKDIEAEIARLQGKLATLKAKPNRSVLVFPKKSLPLEPGELAAVLTKLAEKKFKPGQFAITSSGTDLRVEGDNEVTEWATAVIKKLSEQ